MASKWTEAAGGVGGGADDFLRTLRLPAEEMRSARRWLTATGILSIITGLVALVVPAAASVGTSIFVGWLLVFAGTLLTVHAFSRRSAGDVAVAVLNGLLTLAVGLYIVIFPLSGTVTLTFVLAVWFFGIGLMELVGAWRSRGQPGMGMFAFSGALSAILGALIVASLPSSAGWAIGLLVGINLVFFGLRALLLASALKRDLAT
jgi:uncharacterized membrane protein HdeD (DUF308 family)